MPYAMEMRRPPQTVAPPASRSEQAPPLVHDVLRSPGRPLDAGVRREMEPRFGRSFEGVRVHTDSRAADSARSIGAQAYTVGMHLAFGAARYQPESPGGKRLLAHELAHVVQQGGDSGPGRVQRQGEVRRPRRLPLDADAQAIVDRARDSSRPASERGVELVRAIINRYYADQAASVVSVAFDNARAGTGVQVSQVAQGGRGGTPVTYRGTIYVGDSFLAGAETEFARRVLQVGHELQHIRQWNAGMVGENRSNEREFLAFHDEALATELPGTGSMGHGTRANLIDEALRLYNCLGADLRATYAGRQRALLDRRPREIRYGYCHPDPPPSCERRQCPRPATR